MDTAQLVINLIHTRDQADNAYIIGEIDRAKWAEQMSWISERLAILGLQFTVRPWETSASSADGAMFR